MEKLPTEKTTADAVREFGRAVASLVPLAGGPLQVVFENFFTSPLERRKAAWLQNLAEVLEEVRKRDPGLTLEKLSANDAFVTATMQASQIALRNHQQVKLIALRNAVLNCALSNSLQEDEEIIFLRLIDQLTSSHLRVLSVLDDPANWMARNGFANPGWGIGAVSTVLEHCLPELQGQRDIYDQIVRELQAEGLLGQGQFLYITMTGGGMLESRTPARGKRFIRFIS